MGFKHVRTYIMCNGKVHLNAFVTIAFKPSNAQSMLMAGTSNGYALVIWSAPPFDPDTVLVSKEAAPA